MIVYGSAFAALHDQPDRSPRFVARIFFDDAKTDYMDLTSHSDFTTSATNEFQAVLSVAPGGTSQSFDPMNATASIGSVTIKWGDPNRAIADHVKTKLDAGSGLRNKPVDLYMGYEGLAWADFEQIRGLICGDIDFTGIEYSAKLSDIQRDTKQDIFIPDKTTLSQTITAGASDPGLTVIPFTNASLSIFDVVERDSGHTDTPAVVTTNCSVVVSAGVVTFNLSSGSFPTMVAGQTFRASGFTNAGNNAEFAITAYTSSSMTAPAGSAVTEAAGDTVTIWPHYSYVQIDDEIIMHGGTVNNATYGNSIRVIERGALGTTAVEHTVTGGASDNRKPTIEEYILFEGPAVKLLYAALTGVLYGQSSNTLPDHWHMGISTGFVRLTDFESIGSDWWDTTDPTAGRSLRFLGLKKEDGKRWLEKEVNLWLGAWCPIYSDGAMGIKRLNRVAADAGGAVVFSPDNTVSVDSMRYSTGSVINRVSAEWDYRDEDGERYYAQTKEFLDAQSISEHKDAPPKSYRFKGVTTSAQTDTDLINFFEAHRSRYAAPPWIVRVTCSTRVDNVEPGDVVRLEFPEIYDFTSGATLDRAMEIMSVDVNYGNGQVSYTCIGSTAHPEPIDHYAGTNRMNDLWYGTFGTELEAYLDATYGAATYIDGFGNLQQDITLESGDYHYLGPLQLNGFTVTISGTVRLAVRGEVTPDTGSISGVGGGRTGATASSTYANRYGVAGTSGYIGITRGGGGIGGLGKALVSVQGIVTEAQYQAVPTLPLRNGGGTNLTGLPSDLRGSGGSAGANVFDQTNGTVLATGGNGGTGGAGFLLISRGLQAPASGGTIDLSGTTGSAGGSTSSAMLGFVREPTTKHAGAGSGGAPGAFIYLPDGNYTPPVAGSWLVLDYGDSPIPAGSSPLAQVQNQSGTVARSDYWATLGSAQDAHYYFQFLPDPDAVEVATPRENFQRRVTKSIANVGTTTTVAGVTIGDGTVTGATIETTAGTTAQTVRFNSAANEMEFYGDRGDGTVELLATIGISTSGADSVIGLFGSANVVDTIPISAICTNKSAIHGEATTGKGVVGVATSSGTGVEGSTVTGYGGSFGTPATGSGAPIVIVPAASASAPTHSANAGSLWVTSAGVLYINTSGSTAWAKVGAQ